VNLYFSLFQLESCVYLSADNTGCKKSNHTTLTLTLSLIDWKRLKLLQHTHIRYLLTRWFFPQLRLHWQSLFL
jgi:hypothetical protein